MSEYYKGFDPPAHNHGDGPIQSYPINQDGCCGHGHGHDHMPPPPPPPCTPLPPPIPPVRYVPGMDVQEQLSNMAQNVNVAIDRWNQIQAQCYKALNDVVGACVSNDVYYEPDEVKYTECYDPDSDSNYQLIEMKPCDKAGRPIRMMLYTAYGAGNPGSAGQNMSDASFVTSANAIITARMTPWSGLCIVNGNPVVSELAIPDSWYAGWNDNGKLLIIPNENATIEYTRKRRIDSLIGPIIPAVFEGEVSAQVKTLPATPAAIQAIGFKAVNGHKVMFSCGMEDNLGMSALRVAEIMKSMGCTDAVITCYQTSYDAPDIGGIAVVEEGVIKLTREVQEYNSVTSDRGLNVTAADDNQPSVLGKTGNMMYIGRLADVPLEYQIPQNAAFWIVSKRPGPGWNNRFTAEIADLAQTTGSIHNQLGSIDGKLNLDAEKLLDLQSRTSKLEANDTVQDTAIAQIRTDIASIDTDVKNLQDGLTQAEADIKTNAAAIAALDTRVTAAEGDIDSLETRMDKAETDITTNATDIAALDTRLTTAEGQITDLETRMDTAEGDIKQAETDIDSLETRMDTAEGNITTAQADIKALQKEVSDNSGDITSLQNDLDTEIAARQKGDKQLADALSDETQARTLADTNLKNAIEAEITARETADTALKASLSALEEKHDRELKKEVNDREVADENLQEQIDELSGKVNFTAGPGISKTTKLGGVQEIAVKTGSGLRFDSLGRVAVDTGKGLGVVGGKIVPMLSDDFTINEKGEIEMVCNCNSGDTKPEAGVGLSYSAEPETGKVVLNVDPPKDGQIGGVKAGANITITPDGVISAAGGEGTPYTLPEATTTTLGGIIVGDNLSVDDNGKVSAPAPYTLPVGSADTLGGFKVGSGLSVDANGVLSNTGGGTGSGDVVGAGEGIEVTRADGLTTVALDEDTLAALAQVGDNKAAIDAFNTDLGKKVDNTTYTADKAAMQADITKAAADAASAQSQVAQVSAELETISDGVAEAKSTAVAAQTAANTAQSTAEAANTVAANAKESADAKLPLTGGTINGYVKLNGYSTIIYTDNSKDYAQIIGRPVTGDMAIANMEGKVTNLAVAYPRNLDDAATKQYVDETALQKTGGTLSGPITITGNGQINMTDKSVVFTDFNGETVQITRSNARPGEIAITKPSGYANIGIADPTDPSQAATKRYVDAAITAARTRSVSNEMGVNIERAFPTYTADNSIGAEVAGTLYCATLDGAYIDEISSRLVVTAKNGDIPIGVTKLNVEFSNPDISFNHQCFTMEGEPIGWCAYDKSNNTLTITLQKAASSIRIM